MTDKPGEGAHFLTHSTTHTSIPVLQIQNTQESGITFASAMLLFFGLTGIFLINQIGLWDKFIERVAIFPVIGELISDAQPVRIRRARSLVWRDSTSSSTNLGHGDAIFTDGNQTAILQIQNQVSLEIASDTLIVVEAPLEQNQPKSSQEAELSQKTPTFSVRQGSIRVKTIGHLTATPVHIEVAGRHFEVTGRNIEVKLSNPIHGAPGESSKVEIKNLAEDLTQVASIVELPLTTASENLPFSEPIVLAALQEVSIIESAMDPALTATQPLPPQSLTYPKTVANTEAQQSAEPISKPKVPQIENTSPLPGSILQAEVQWENFSSTANVKIAQGFQPITLYRDPNTGELLAYLQIKGTFSEGWLEARQFLRFQLHHETQDLVVHLNSNSQMDRTPAQEQEQTFEVMVPLKQKTTQIIALLENDTKKNTQVLGKVVVDLPQLSQLNEQEPSHLPETTLTHIGLGFSSNSYRQTNREDFSQTGLNLRASYQWFFVPGRWSLWASGTGTLLQLSSKTTGSQIGTKLHTVATNLRIAANLPRDGWGMWRAQIATGLYYTTQVVTKKRFGYRNLFGPQLWFMLNRPLWNHKTFGSFYTRASLVTTGTSVLGPSSHDITLGTQLTWLLDPTLKNMSLSMEYSKLSLVLPGLRIDQKTLGLGLTYGW